MRKLTKKQVEQMYKDEVLPYVKQTYEQDGQIDGPARREYWHNFTDSLCKDRQITEKQYNNWTVPAICG